MIKACRMMLARDDKKFMYTYRPNSISSSHSYSAAQSRLWLSVVVFVLAIGSSFGGSIFNPSATACFAQEEQPEKVERDVYGNVVVRDKDNNIVPNELAPTVTDGTHPLSDSNLLLLKTIQESNPTTAFELARATQIMLDIGQFWDARYYLSEIEKLNLNEEQLFELQQAFGSNLFIDVSNRALVQPEGRRLGTRVLRAARKVSLTPARISELIKVLNNDDISVRSEAFRKLRRLGEPAVAELINVFADQNRKSEFPGIRGALQAIDSNAQGPLLGAARASNPRVQVEAIRALANFKTPESLDVMMRAYLSPEMPEYSRRIALDALTKNRYPADPGYIEQRLFDRSKEYLLGERFYPGAVLGNVTIWNFNAKTKRMVPANVPAETALRIVASRRAADLYEVRPDLQRNRELYLLTQFEAAKRLAGPSRKLDVDSIVESLKVDANDVENILQYAMEMELVPAAVGCCEVLGKIGSAELLMGTSTKPRTLVDAILFGDRYLQFAAMQAINNIDPQQAYPGSSYVVSLAVYLSQSENRPAGLVGHVSEGIGQTYAAALSSAGVFEQSVTTGREFFKAATRNPDIDMLIVTDTLDKPYYGELIQQLRSDWRTRRLPIALLYRDPNQSRRVKIRMGDDPRFAVIPFSSDPELVASHIVRLNENAKPWKLSNFDRRRHASGAVSWLAKISSDRDVYSFYNLGSEQEKLARLLYIPGFSADASLILANLGTPTAQRELVNFASQSGSFVENDELQKVVDAFAQSVKTSGTLLTTKEIRQQYDRYNASQNETKAYREILGSILNVIESKRDGNGSE